MDTRFYLDARKCGADKKASLKVIISKDRKAAYIPVGINILPSQWNSEAGRIKEHPQKKELNAFIQSFKQRIDTILFQLSSEVELKEYSAIEIRDMVLSELNPGEGKKKKRKVAVEKTFLYRFQKFADSKSKGTKACYVHTISRMKAFAPNLDELTFEDITKEWLTSFDTYLAQTAPSKNARNVHMRNIRAVFNEAIDDDITTFYPFRRFKIRPVATKKRALTVEELRTLFTYDVDDYAIQHRDMFKLIFMLIGINCVDLCNLKTIRDGRVEYYRAKTHRLYSIKVEPEALEIIDRYHGKDWLLNILDRNTDHRNYLKHLNRALKNIGVPVEERMGRNVSSRALFPEISTYWARHTWATIAAQLDIPKDTIAHALGHGNNTVTDIYIDFDQKKVDEANRKVLDWVLYGEIDGKVIATENVIERPKPKKKETQVEKTEDEAA